MSKVRSPVYIRPGKAQSRPMASQAHIPELCVKAYMGAEAMRDERFALV
jgi:hypothetical protein